MGTPDREHCELCEAARLTTWFHEDEHCWVATCEACDVPMVVWRVHDHRPSPELLEHMLSVLAAVAARIDPDPRRWWLDDRPRTILDHWHAHARQRQRPGA